MEEMVEMEKATVKVVEAEGEDMGKVQKEENILEVEADIIHLEDGITVVEEDMVQEEIAV